MTASDLPNFWDFEVAGVNTVVSANSKLNLGIDNEFLRVCEIVSDMEKASWLESRTEGLARGRSILRDGMVTPVVDARSQENGNFLDFEMILVETMTGDRLAIALLSTARVLRIAMQDESGTPNIIAAVSVKSMKRLKILRNNLTILLSIVDLLTETKGAFVWR